MPSVAAPVVASAEPAKPATVSRPTSAAAQAEAKKPPVAAPVATAEPAKPAPLKPADPALQPEPKPVPVPVVVTAEPAQTAAPPAAPVPTPKIEAKPPATAPMVASAEPAKPAQAAPPVSQAEPKPTVTTPVIAAVEPAGPAAAKPVPVTPPETEQAFPAVQSEPAKPAASRVLAEAKTPTDGGSPFAGTAGVIAEPQPASSSAPKPAQPSAVVAQADPAQPAAKAAPVPEPVAPAAPRFEITRYAVEGNTLLKQEIVDAAVAPFSGPGKDFGDVQRALEALQLAYQKEGWGGVEIRLPEQELDKGIVRLRVVEPRIAKISVEGNQHFSEANIRRSVPALREGETPNSREIGKGIRLANENPSKQSAVVLRASEREDHLEATIRVADVDPKRYSVSLDNTGNVETQRERLGVAFQHSNMFGRDHVMTLQAITAPKNFNDVQVIGLGYRIPIYSLGDSVDLVAGYSNVDSGTVQDLFVVAGAGTVFAARYNQNLPRWGDLEHRLSYGLDYRAYQNDVKPVGGEFNLVPDITVHPFSVTYSGAWRAEGKGEFSYYLSLVQNIPGGSDGQDEHFKQIGARFPDGSAGYRLFRTGLSYARPIGWDWQIRVRADGQYTDDALVSGEMFAIGGADSVRGLNERYVSNDKGYRTSWEIYTPDLAKDAGFDGRWRFLAFYDQGLLRRNKVQPGELEQQSLDSAGVGLRLSYKNNLTLRFDVAFVLHDGTTAFNVNGKDGQTKAHFALAWVW
jgi:hemolysin activation/secretion protein